MDLSNYHSMDPDLLVGVVNTAIRNHTGTLAELCACHDLEETVLREQLATAASFLPEQQFVKTGTSAVTRPVESANEAAAAPAPPPYNGDNQRSSAHR